MNLSGRFKTDVDNANIFLEITFYDLELDATIQSTKWYTSDADIDGSIDELKISDRFNISTGEFENFQVELHDFNFT